MKIEAQVQVEAPPRTVCDFFAWLDHLRLVSPGQRREWCPTPGQRVAEGREREVCLQQGRHRVRLSFRTERFRPAECIEDVFLTWPMQGARRVLRFAPVPGPDRLLHTSLVEIDEWRPPFFVRALVDKRLEQQRALFDEKLRRAKAIIERAHDAHGPEVFSGGVLEPARALGFGELQAGLHG